MLKRGTPRRSLAPPCPCAPDAPNEGMVNPSGIGDGELGNGILVIGRDGVVVDVVGAALVAAAADEDEPAIIVDPNPGSP